MKFYMCFKNMKNMQFTVKQNNMAKNFENLM